MKKHQTKAFTLVELIIVITILAILATIGFMSYQSYTVDARDGKRVADLGQIRKGLEIYQTKNAKLPTPDEQITNIVNGGNLLGYQGYAGTNVLTKIRADRVKDPKDNLHYTYSTNGDYTKFQLLSMLENGNLVNISQTPVNTTYAANNYTDRKTYVIGNKLGVFLNSSNAPIQETLSGNIDLGGAYSGTSFKVVFTNTSANSGTIVGSGVSLYNNVVTIANTITQTQVSTPVSKLNVVDFFGDNSGKALYRFENNANDTGLNYNGIASNLIYGIGRFGTGITLNGTNSVFAISSNPIPKINNVFTISNWLKYNSTNSVYMGFGRKSGDVSYNGSRRFRISGGSFAAGKAQIPVGTSSKNVTITSDTNWHNYIAVSNGTKIDFYIDGVYNSSNTYTSDDLIALNSYTNWYGILEETNWYGINNSLDQVRIFNRALNPSEVTQLYNEQ